MKTKPLSRLLDIEQLRIGNIVYIADYVPVRKTKKMMCFMHPRIIDSYWLFYLTKYGKRQVDGVPLDKAVLLSIRELFRTWNGFAFKTEDFVIDIHKKKSEDDVFHVFVNDIAICPLYYLHQLQNVFTTLTGSTLDISETFEQLEKYRDTKRESL